MVRILIVLLLLPTLSGCFVFRGLYNWGESVGDRVNATTGREKCTNKYFCFGGSSDTPQKYKTTTNYPNPMSQTPLRSPQPTAQSGYSNTPYGMPNTNNPYPTQQGYGSYGQSLYPQQQTEYGANNPYAAPQQPSYNTPYSNNNPYAVPTSTNNYAPTNPYPVSQNPYAPTFTNGYAPTNPLGGMSDPQYNSGGGYGYAPIASNGTGAEPTFYSEMINQSNNDLYDVRIHPSHDPTHPDFDPNNIPDTPPDMPQQGWQDAPKPANQKGLATNQRYEELKQALGW